MAHVVHEFDGEILFTGTVHQCEQHIANLSATDPKGVQAGDYGINMTEQEDAEYQSNRWAGFGSAP